jgi:hypothetical protein
LKAEGAAIIKINILNATRTTTPTVFSPLPLTNAYNIISATNSASPQPPAETNNNPGKSQETHPMNLAGKLLSILLLLPLISVPALADFKYTDTSQITGGALMGMANFAAKFSKDSRAAMQPITTTHYIKGNRLRTDGSDGSIQIIDLDGKRIISIDNQKKTYAGTPRQKCSKKTLENPPPRLRTHSFR